MDKILSAKIFKKLNHYELDVDFDLGKEVLVIQGPSGAGKTTVLDCIAGIKKPDRGYIAINGRTVFSSEDRINASIKERNVGYVFQHYALFPNMTVEENLKFGINEKDKEELDYLRYLSDKFKISHLEKSYPGNISGGEKQRVALARSLARRPKAMILDEPFSALDEDTKEVLYEEFLQFKKEFEMGIVLITHNSKEAKLLGDRFIRMNGGKIEHLNANEKDE